MTAPLWDAYAPDNRLASNECPERVTETSRCGEPVREGNYYCDEHEEYYLNYGVVVRHESK